MHGNVPVSATENQKSGLGFAPAYAVNVELVGSDHFG